MDPVFFCVSSSPFPIHACLVSANSYAKHAAYRSLILTKGGGKDKMLLLLWMRGPMPFMPRHAPNPNERKKKTEANGRVAPCDAMRCVCAMWIPTNMPALTKRGKKKAKDNVGCPTVTWCRLPAGTHAARDVVVWLFDLECSIVPQSIALHAGIRDGTAPVFFPSSLTGRRRSVTQPFTGRTPRLSRVGQAVGLLSCALSDALVSQKRKS